MPYRQKLHFDQYLDLGAAFGFVQEAFYAGGDLLAGEGFVDGFALLVERRHDLAGRGAAEIRDKYIPVVCCFFVRGYDHERGETEIDILLDRDPLGDDRLKRRIFYRVEAHDLQPGLENGRRREKRKRVVYLLVDLGLGRRNARQAVGLKGEKPLVYKEVQRLV